MTREEAINLIKQVLPCLNIDEKIREGFVTLIPELKESEDERIRKELIDFFDSALGKDLLQRKCGLNPDTVLAYLEKEKESVNLSYSDIETIQTALRVSGLEFSANREAYEKLEGQKEQKPAEWSEEDKGLLERAISIIGWAGSCTDKYKIINPDGAAELRKFLKSLPERFNLPPKVEWSEEDEQTFIKSVETLEYLGKFELADWLKDHKNQFLKPQNTWKPSEEEIGALAEAMERNDKIGYLLHQLHEELKHNYKL